MDFYELFNNFRHNLNNDDFNGISEIFNKLRSIDLSQEFNFVHDVIEKDSLKNPEKTALIHYDMDTERSMEISYRDLVNRSNALLSFLRLNGLKKGSIVYLMMPVVPEQWYALTATIKGGMIAIPCATNLTEYEMKNRFSDLKPDAIIADERSANLIDNIIPENTLRIVLGEKKNWESYNEIKFNKAEYEKTYYKDPILNYFTSGTTGLPKRVIHSAVGYPIGHMSTAAFIGIKSDYIHLNLSATGWAKFAWSSYFAPLIMNATILGINYSGKLNSEKYISLLEKYHVNSFCAPPTAWKQFILIKDLKLPELKVAVSAGEPLNPEVINRFKEKTMITIRDFYGQTESTAMIGNMPGDDIIPGSMGRPSEMYHMVLLDEENKEINENDKIGNIAVKLDYNNTGLLLGYSDESRNRAAFVNNYYLTGDKAYLNNGHWFFVSRNDDIIKTSDYRVGPFEVESALMVHDAVAEAAVIGINNPEKYEIIKAFIILKPGYNPSMDLAISLKNKVSELLPYYKVPSVIEFVNELPKTISNKTRRNVLRDIESKKSSRGEHEYIIK
ncbi:AMP-binding protein [Picrophilus oshimae]|uniref:Acetyl-CoA synthetase n=1 Tax=Picrophilus torridus (strain ATCC 700027 / DSM 9790 / JCM 10055 / NBRC 100828 / KAW 2/3) TaxID=1122961 RepID=A0A8G2L7M8_PICTO|nr:AMP-binding protein [Picrophilus oshimae]SMD30479.1 acetyl-CoA synthetase [Picrophilus oshimae DSM 9789]